MAVAPTQDVKAYRNYIGGEWVEAAGGETFEVENPSSGDIVATVPKGGREDAHAAIAAARESFDSGIWADMDPDERVRIMKSVVDKFTQNEDELAELESLQSGMTMRSTATVVIGYCIEHWDYFARQAGRSRQEPLPPVSFPTHSYNFVLRDPIGVCAGIIPWNFPLVMAVWKLAPALAMGNSVVLKPASNTPLTALRLAELLDETDLPKGVVNVITGGGATVGEELASHPDVDKVSFTGSTVVGRRIMQLASSTIKKCTLELGGKSPNIVYEDANIEAAVDGALWATFFHQGQVCESGTRLLAARVDPRRVRRAPGGAGQGDQDRRRAGLRLRHGPAGLGGAVRDRVELRAHRPGGGRQARARRRPARPTPPRAATTSSPRSSPTWTTR